MVMQEGETYTCTEPSCGCRIEVTKSPEPGGGGDQNPRCCCGSEMRKTG